MLALALAPSITAQPKRERITYSWVMELRQQLVEECRGKAPEVLEQVAADLVSEDRGNPLIPLARALARVRGVDADDAFVFRRAVHCLATPEVVDDGKFEHVHLTMHTPYRTPFDGAVAFRLRILDAEGEPRWSGEITQGTATDDLMRYRATVKAPVADLEDGTYHVEVDTVLDDRAPRPKDPRSRARFCVLRGFPERWEALQKRVLELRDGMDPATALVVNAALAPLQRRFFGEPPQGRSRTSDDLERAEAIVDNVAAGRPAFHGLEGWVPLAVATGEDEAAMLSVRLPSGPAPAPRPLLLFVPGGPAWDQGWSRPTSPQTTSPQWLRDLLVAERFDPEHRALVAVMESPGRVQSAAGAVAAVIADLRGRFATPGGTVLVGERQGASAIVSALTRHPDLARAFALVAGGSLDPASAQRFADHRVLAVPCRDHPANVNLERAAELLREAGAQVRVLPADRLAWPIALPLVLPEIGALL